MINRVVLVGRLTKDADLRYTPNGVPVATFTLAVNRPYSNAQGEREADFLPVVVWRKVAENVANYTRKGSMVGVEGRIQVRNYENNEGRKVYVTEIIADSVQFLESKTKTEQNQTSSGNSNRFENGNENGGYNSGNNNHGNPSYNEPFFGGQPIDISDDDLPF